jgi:drug/metabolite transporter (DMT)-like permease
MMPLQNPPDSGGRTAQPEKPSMPNPRIGEFAALAVAVFWTITALAFESASKKVGSLPVNWIRLVLGFLFLTAFTGLVRGKWLPLDAGAHAWIWLSLSGFVGFVLGDLFLFRAFVLIGSRVSMLIMALAPPMTAVLGRLFLGESLSALSLAGMSLTLAGIALVVIDRPSGEAPMRLAHPVAGVLFALGGAAGQAAGLILSKIGMRDYSPFAATQIRILTGIAGFACLLTVRGAWGRTASAMRHPKAMSLMTAGAFFGPFLGVSFSLFAVQHTAAGIASTIMSTVPVLIIPPAVLFMKEKITFREVTGALIAIGGVALLFI